MWRGLAQEHAEARALHVASEEAPGQRAVVRNSEIHGIDWVVRMWVFRSPLDEAPREALCRVRATDGEPVGFEMHA